MNVPDIESFCIAYPRDAVLAMEKVRIVSLGIGFNQIESEQMVLVVSELAGNLLKYARGGIIKLIPLNNDGRCGLQVESEDSGPGIADPGRAMTDGYSTGGSLGFGLGTVNRIMDEFEVMSPTTGGTLIVGRRWVRLRYDPICPHNLSFGVATRPRSFGDANGDAFIVKHGGHHALAGVIDGLGHGLEAHKASLKARNYIEAHYDQSLDLIFTGVDRACRASRGVVMALVQFDLREKQFCFASIGNIMARLFNIDEKFNPVVRRGIIGLNAPKPVVTTHRIQTGSVMVMHSDGLHSHWDWNSLPPVTWVNPSDAASRLMHTQGKEDDDATVVVIRSEEI